MIILIEAFFHSMAKLGPCMGKWLCKLALTQAPNHGNAFNVNQPYVSSSRGVCGSSWSSASCSCIWGEADRRWPRSRLLHGLKGPDAAGVGQPGNRCLHLQVPVKFKTYFALLHAKYSIAQQTTIKSEIVHDVADYCYQTQLLAYCSSALERFGGFCVCLLYTDGKLLHRYTPNAM